MEVENLGPQCGRLIWQPVRMERIRKDAKTNLGQRGAMADSFVSDSQCQYLVGSVGQE